MASHLPTSVLVNLTSILQNPFEQHDGSVIAGGLSVGDLLCVFDWLPTLVATEQLGLPAAKNCVLHAAMFHLLGGHAANLHPPPPTSAAARAPEFAVTRTLHTEAARMAAQRAKLSKHPTELAALLGQELSGDNCCLLRGGKTAGGEQTKVVAADSGDPPPSSPAEAELRRRAVCSLAFAMGTHCRLGVSSGVRLIVDQHDILRLITKYAELRMTDWVAHPPPKEVPTLRRHLMLEHAELLITRQRWEDAQVLAKSLLVEAERLRRQLQSMQQRMAAETERVEEIREGAGKWKQLVAAECEQQAKHQRREHAQALREQKRELTERWMTERDVRLEDEAQHVRELENMSSDRREDSAKVCWGAQTLSARGCPL